jgi:hypothetical protein
VLMCVYVFVCGVWTSGVYSQCCGGAPEHAPAPLPAPLADARRRATRSMPLVVHHVRVFPAAVGCRGVGAGQDGTLDVGVTAVLEDAFEILSFDELKFGGPAVAPKPGAAAAAAGASRAWFPLIWRWVLLSVVRGAR